MPVQSMHKSLRLSVAQNKQVFSDGRYRHVSDVHIDQWLTWCGRGPVMSRVTGLIVGKPKHRPMGQFIGIYKER